MRPVKSRSRNDRERRQKLPGPRIHKAGNLFRRQYRLAINENDVATHAQRRRGARQFNRLIGRAGARHQGGAGDQARSMQLRDGPVHARGQSKIVGVDDETAHSPEFINPRRSNFRMMSTLLS